MNIAIDKDGGALNFFERNTGIMWYRKEFFEDIIKTLEKEKEMCCEDLKVKQKLCWECEKPAEIQKLEDENTELKREVTRLLNEVNTLTKDYYEIFQKLSTLQSR